jgi:hypothetical protein
MGVSADVAVGPTINRHISWEPRAERCARRYARDLERRFRADLLPISGEQVAVERLAAARRAG